MELTATGTAINFNQGVETGFSLQFALTGGTLQSFGCDSALGGAQVSNFSATIDGHSYAAPSSFLASVTTSPYPTCAGPQYVEITNVATGSNLNWLTLEYEKFTNPVTHSMFTGAIGDWYVADASYTVTNTVPEPGMLSLTAVALLTAAIIGRRYPVSSFIAA